MRPILLSSILALQSALAMPSEQPGQLLQARDKPKLNQYRTLDDCHKDRNILFHAAPTSGNCYDLDRETGAFFYNTGGFLFSSANKDIGCNGDSIRLRGAKCIAKGDLKSVVMR